LVEFDMFQKKSLKTNNKPPQKHNNRSTISTNPMSEGEQKFKDE